jgi:hypothetical protein
VWQAWLLVTLAFILRGNVEMQTATGKICFSEIIILF